MSINATIHEIECEINKLQQELDIAVSIKKDFLLANRIQQQLNEKEEELKNELQREERKSSFSKATFPSAEEVHTISSTVFKERIADLETGDEINVTMSFIGKIISIAAARGHSMVSVSGDEQNLVILFENGSTFNLGNGWIKSATSAIESYKKDIEKTQYSNEQKNLRRKIMRNGVTVMNRDQEGKNMRENMKYLEEKISFIQDLNVDEVILQSIKHVFKYPILRSIIMWKLVEMKYLIGEAVDLTPVLRCTPVATDLLVISLWPTRKQKCKYTFIKYSSAPKNNKVLIQEDSMSENIMNPYQTVETAFKPTEISFNIDWFDEMLNLEPTTPASTRVTQPPIPPFAPTSSSAASLTLTNAEQPPIAPIATAAPEPDL